MILKYRSSHCKYCTKANFSAHSKYWILVFFCSLSCAVPASSNGKWSISLRYRGYLTHYLRGAADCNLFSPPIPTSAPPRQPLSAPTPSVLFVGDAVPTAGVWQTEKKTRSLCRVRSSRACRPTRVESVRFALTTKQVRLIKVVVRTALRSEVQWVQEKKSEWNCCFFFCFTAVLY